MFFGFFFLASLIFSACFICLFFFFLFFSPVPFSFIFLYFCFLFQINLIFSSPFKPPHHIHYFHNTQILAHTQAPLDALAGEWLAHSDYNPEVRFYLVEKLLPTIIMGLDKILREVSWKKKKMSLASWEFAKSSLRSFEYGWEKCVRENVVRRASTWRWSCCPRSSWDWTRILSEWKMRVSEISVWEDVCDVHGIG